RGTRTDHSHAMSSAHAWHLRGYPTFTPCAIDDLHFHLFDRHGVSVDAKHARGFARRGTQPTSELREVVGGVQPLDGIAPVSAIHEIIPIWYQVSKRTSVVAKRNSAVHAATSLSRQLVNRKRLVYLFPILHSHGYSSSLWRLTIPLQKTGWLTHLHQPLPSCSVRRSLAHSHAAKLFEFWQMTSSNQTKFLVHAQSWLTRHDD
ncbi:MAG: hypothetical protein RL415_1025, partial [Actinomycetota bacterium]